MPVRTSHFGRDIGFSKGRRQDTDLDTIRQWIPGATDIRIAHIDEERLGIDYVVTLREGATVHVDGKARRVGCSAHWRCPVTRIAARRCRCHACRDGGDPEMALELWSVRPTYLPLDRDEWTYHPHNPPEGVTGWTLSEEKETDAILFTFDPRDTPYCYLLPFQHLRVAFRRHYHVWQSRFESAVQRTTRRDGSWYYSECLFVPARDVLYAVSALMEGEYDDGTLSLFDL